MQLQDSPPGKKDKPFFDELLEGADKKYKSPDPDSLGLTALRADYVIHHTVLPVVGVNSFILGLVWLHHLHAGGTQRTLALIAALAAMVLFTVLLRLSLLTSDRFGLFAGAAVVCVILASLVLAPGWAGSVLVFVLAFTVAAATVTPVWRPSEIAVGLIALYVPILLGVFRQEYHIQRLVAETIALLPLFVASHRAGFRKAQLIVLFSAVVAGIVEVNTLGGKGVVLSLILGVFVFLGIYYEWRIKEEGQSMLRRFLNSAPVVFLLWLAVNAFPWIENRTAATWLWLGLIMAYQVLQARRYGWVFETRAQWMAFALFFAIWQSDFVPNWQSASLLGLSAALMLHLFALREANSFVALGAILLVLVTALWNTFYLRESALSMMSVVVILMTTGLALLVARFDRPKAVPWWTGLIAERHLDWLRSAGLASVGLVLRIPMMATVFAWMRAGILWIRYIKGPDKPLAVNDLLIAAAHGYGAWALAGQAALAMQLANPPEWWLLSLRSAIWIAWGTLVLLYGVLRNMPFYRLLGASLVLTPVALTYWVWPTTDDFLSALLATIVGAALAIGGALYRIMEWREQEKVV